MRDPIVLRADRHSRVESGAIEQASKSRSFAILLRRAYDLAHTEDEMRIFNIVITAVAFFALLATTAPAQVRYRIPEPQIERAEETDAEGLKQWKTLDEICTYCNGRKISKCGHCVDTELPTCAECDNKKEAPCRYCGGAGKKLDPLVELPCPYCVGAAWHDCALCKSRGSYPVQGGGASEQKCGACKEKGAIPCTVCKGKRVIAVVKVGKKGPGYAKAEEIREAKEDLAKAKAAVEAYVPAGKENSKKDLAKAVSKYQKMLPALKDMQGLLDETLNGLRKGAGYVGYDEWLLNEFVVFKDRTIYLLKHQMLLLDLCLAHAEHNEKVEAEKK